jgi:hypothetical protein
VRARSAGRLGALAGRDRRLGRGGAVHVAAYMRARCAGADVQAGGVSDLASSVGEGKVLTDRMWRISVCAWLR